MLEADKPYLRVRLHGVAEVECCYTSAEPLTATWVKNNGTKDIKRLNPLDHVTKGSKNMGTTKCSMLVLKSVELSDAGLYQCLLNNSITEQLSHGTYLHVYSKCSSYWPGWVRHSVCNWERWRHLSAKHC